MKNGLIGESRSGHLLFGANGCCFQCRRGLFGNSARHRSLRPKIELV